MVKVKKSSSRKTNRTNMHKAKKRMAAGFKITITMIIVIVAVAGIIYYYRRAANLTVNNYGELYEEFTLDTEIDAIHSSMERKVGKEIQEDIEKEEKQHIKEVTINPSEITHESNLDQIFNKLVLDYHEIPCDNPHNKRYMYQAIPPTTNTSYDIRSSPTYTGPADNSKYGIFYHTPIFGNYRDIRSCPNFETIQDENKNAIGFSSAGKLTKSQNIRQYWSVLKDKAKKKKKKKLKDSKFIAEDIQTIKDTAITPQYIV